MKFTAPILILYGPGGRRETTGFVTFTATSIHHARRVLADGLVCGYGPSKAHKIKPVRRT
jgi:hypothetical protein